MNEFVTLLLASASNCASDRVTAFESLNITAFLNNPVLLVSCLKAVLTASGHPPNGWHVVQVTNAT
jgi:hypothetical protein